MGAPVRHDGGARPVEDPRLAAWRAEGRLVPLCPEGLGGLPTPRPPAEIEPGQTATSVLAGAARILTDSGADVTEAFVAGAHRALRIAQETGCAFALLTERSPSCGVREVHAGRHDGTRIPGQGVTAALLLRHGIAVFGEDQLDALEAALSDRRAPLRSPGKAPT